MYADVERFSDQPEKHFLRVVQQQGRVSLAADGNEQVELLLSYIMSLAADVIGPHGTPSDKAGKEPGPGFKIEVTDGTMTIGPGHYWVDGLLCQNPAPVSFKDQPSSFPDLKLPTGGQYLAYLDVWERYVTAAQDDSIRDVALGGPDTSSRSQLVWQVKLLAVIPVDGDDLETRATRDMNWENWLQELERAPRARLAVDVDEDSAPADPCQVPPGAGYFGNENQLYRVEIHRGSTTDVDGRRIPPTFKWSRDNGSVVYPLTSVVGNVAVLRDPPIDSRKSLATGVLVEVVDDRSSLLEQPGPLRRVVSVDDDGDDMVVHLSGDPIARIDARSRRHPMLRRWDHPPDTSGATAPKQADDGALLVTEGPDAWLALEDGIKIRFAASPVALATAVYRTGDHWTVAARADTAGITWASDAAGKPAEVEPRGITHHYAPLAVLTLSDAGKVDGAIQDFRNGFAPIASLPL